MDFGMHQGRYTILGEIAAGGTATVFLAEDSVLRRKVALKKLHPHLLNHPEMVRRFEKEALAVASLSHENVIKIFDYGQEEKSVFLAMEYVDGVSVDALLREAGGTLPCLAALSLFQQLFAGLAAAHARGICHRDIKPSNVLVDRRGCVRIADFGIAFLSEETSITRTGSYLGTPGYSSPEQAQGEMVTVKTDIFAAGILLYRSLAGHLPFDAESPHAVLMSIMEKTPCNLNLVNRRLVPGLADMVDRMLSKAPAHRPTAEECASEVAALARDLDLPLDAGRIRRLYESPQTYAAQDLRDLAQCYQRRARLAHGRGQSREAIKLYALAEAVAEPGGEIALEASGHLRRLRSAARLRLALAGAATLCVFVFAGWILSSLPKATKAAVFPAPSAAKPGPARFAIAPAVAPPAAPQLVSLTLPAASSPPPAGMRVVTGELPEEKPAARSLPAPSMAAIEPGRAQGPAGIAGHARRSPARVGTAASRRAEGGPSATEELASAEPHASAPSPLNGFLWIRTNPPFVRIAVDGQGRGATPLASPLPLPAGKHQLDLEREGCLPAHESITVAPSETLALRLTLDRKPETP